MTLEIEFQKKKNYNTIDELILTNLHCLVFSKKLQNKFIL